MPDSTNRNRGSTDGHLSADDVLDEAIAIADSDGLDSLSIRRLAAHLELAPMTIYGYFDSKDDLLDRMADRMFDRFESPNLSSSDWAIQAAAVMIAFRELLLTHPSLAQLLTTRRVVSLGVTRSIEAVLVHLRAGGLDSSLAVQAYAALFAYTLGFVVFELPRTGDREAEDEEVARILKRLSETRRFTNVEQLAAPLSQMARKTDFEYGLNLIMEGLRNSVRSQTSPDSGNAPADISN